MNDIEDSMYSDDITKINNETNINILKELNDWCLHYKKDSMTKDFCQFMHKTARENKSILKKTQLILLYRDCLVKGKLEKNVIVLFVLRSDKIHHSLLLQYQHDQVLCIL